MEIYDNEIMNFERFKDRLIADLQERYGDSEKVTVGKSAKVNQGELTYITLKKPDMTPAPTLYMEHLYEDYVRCGSLHEVLDKTIRAFAIDIPKESRIKISDITDTAAVLEKAYCQVIGAKGNETFLKTVPYKRHEDLAIIYRLLAGRDKQGVYSVMITNEHIEMLGISQEKLHERALANTEKFFPAEVADISKFLPFPEASGFTMQMLVLTHEAKTCGAIAALYPGLLQELSEKTGKDLFLLPSSIHEFMVLPDTGEYDAKGLRSMVREINMKMMNKDDILTDSVYRFRSGDKALSLCKEERRKNRGRDDR